jgi:hypothetical protein
MLSIYGPTVVVFELPEFLGPLYRPAFSQHVPDYYQQLAGHRNYGFVRL